MYYAYIEFFCMFKWANLVFLSVYSMLVQHRYIDIGPRWVGIKYLPYPQATQYLHETYLLYNVFFTQDILTFSLSCWQQQQQLQHSLIMPLSPKTLLLFLLSLIANRLGKKSFKTLENPLRASDSEAYKVTVKETLKGTRFDYFIEF